MTDARLSVEVGGKIDELKAVLTQGKASVKDFVGYTDAQLLASGGNYNKYANDVARASREASLARIKAAGDAARAEIASSKEASTASELSFTSIGQSATKGLSALRQIAYVLPGIGVAGIFSLAFEGIMKASEALDIFSTKLSAAAQNRIALNDAISKGNQEAGKEITTLKILYDAATDVSNSTDTRAKAAKELQKLFPETFKNTSLEAIEAGKLSGAYQQLTQDIIANARAKSIAAKIGELSAKLLDADIQSAKIENAKVNELSRVNGAKITGSLAGAGQQDVLGSTTSTSEQAQRQDINTRAKLANDANDLNKKILNDQIKFLESFTNPKALVNSITDKNKNPLTDKLDAWQELNLKLKEISANVNSTFDEKAKAQITAYNDAINALLKQGINPVSIEIGNLQGKIMQLSETLSMEKIGADAFKELSKQIGDTVKNFGKLQDIAKQSKDALNSYVEKIESGMGKNLKIFNVEAVSSQGANLINVLKSFNKDASSIISDGIVKSFEYISTAIGSALSGGGNIVKTLGANLLSAFGDVLGQLGEMAIKTGLAILAIKISLKTLNPFVAIAAGVGLLALAGVVKHGASNISDNISGGGAPQVQTTAGINTTSGSNSGVTNGSNSVAMQTVQVKAVISGRDLVMLLNLEGYYLSRVQQHG